VVWVLPGGQRSYSQALMWTIEFLAERRVIPIVAGTAFGGSHLKRRIEMIMTHKLNRRMSRRAIIAVVVLGACVLPVAAQKPRNEPSSTVQESTSNPAPVAGAPVGRSQPAADNRSLEARIEQLERLVHELSQTVKHSAADASTPGRINHGDPAVASKIDVISGKWTSGRIPHFPSPAPENEEDRQLKEILVALSKQSWEAAGRRDWIVYEKLLAEDYHGFYVNSSGSGRVDKATTIAAVKRRRYFDLSMQDVEARRIGNDTAIFTYIYSCKVEEAGQLQTYRDHQATQVWTRKTDAWVLSFAQEFVLPGGE